MASTGLCKTSLIRGLTAQGQHPSKHRAESLLAQKMTIAVTRHVAQARLRDKWAEHKQLNLQGHLTSLQDSAVSMGIRNFSQQ